MAKHEVLYPLVQGEMPGCPSPLLRSAFNRAAAELCQRGLVWQETLDAFWLQPGEWRYALELPAGSRVVVVRSVKKGATELWPVNDGRGRYPWGQHSGEPLRYALLGGWREIGVDPVPVASEAVTLTVALAPAIEAATLPDGLVERYGETLAEGVKAQLKRMNGQTWTDLAGAELSRHLFAVQVDAARVEQAYGYTCGTLRVTPRCF